MNRYLTNVEIPFERLEKIVNLASRTSGFDVVAVKGPMPNDDGSTYYHPERLQHLNSILTNEYRGKDHSLFWDAYESAEKEIVA